MFGSPVPRFSAFTLLFTAGLLANTGRLVHAQAVPTTNSSRGHAHNDYLHQRPLLDALDHGFGSVEADVFLVEGELLVAHTRSELSPERTLKGLYLEPLLQRVQQNGGSVYGDGQAITLLIDIKFNGAATFEVLHRMLLEYRPMLTYVENGEIHLGAVKAVVSGERAMDAIIASSPRLVGIDGRLSDLDSKLPAHLMPLISDNWGVHFAWRGAGAVPAADRERLMAIVAKAHQHGRLLRLWAIPDNPAAWQLMQEAGADLINTDNLAGLRRFLDRNAPPP